MTVIRQDVVNRDHARAIYNFVRPATEFLLDLGHSNFN